MDDISKAVGLLTELKKDEDEDLLVQEIWAIKLGIEALERENLRREYLRASRLPIELLPSETEGEK